MKLMNLNKSIIVISGESIRSKLFNITFESVIISNEWYLKRIHDEQLYKVRLKIRTASIRSDDDCDFELVPVSIS